MAARQTAHATPVDRKALADLILARLEAERDSIAAAYASSAVAIPYFWVDDLLPVEIANAIRTAFPQPETMKLKKSLREFKYIAAQMDQYDPILEEVIFSFQDPRIVTLIGKLTGIRALHPDKHLYAGGISMMGKDQYLNPHVDNSHDKDRERWRVLNLLYYVSEGWDLENGGNLELWPTGLEGEQITIHSRFNRLAVMATHDHSWHSVSPIKADDFRCCVSNYYFSEQPLRDGDQFHVTSFRGRPEQPVADKLLQADALLRTGIRKVLSKGIGNKGHVYRRSPSEERR